VIPNRDEELRLLDPAEIERVAGVLAEAIFAWQAELAALRAAADPAEPKVGDEAISDPAGLPYSPPLRLTEALPGLEFGLLPVFFHGRAVDRLALLRADPKRFRLGVFHDDAKPKSIVDWQTELGAAAVINSSYYTEDLQPQTPILAGGVKKGPPSYQSKHGAMLAEPAGKGLPAFAFKDYSGQAVDLAPLGYREAVVSYPTLLDGLGRVRAAQNPGWRADRSFIGIDRQGRILLGTSEGGFFSLWRLGQFLRALPGLQAAYALNLDGGPPACLAVRAGELEFTALGRYESNDSTGQEVIFWGAEEVVWPLPAVIALFPR
jgi:hypothetical protein